MESVQEVKAKCEDADYDYDEQGLTHIGIERFSQEFLTEDLCKEIQAKEEQTDQAIREGVTRLFAEEKDPIAVLKKKEIYDIFERLSDATQKLANALQNVSIKAVCFVKKCQKVSSFGRSLTQFRLVRTSWLVVTS